MNSRFRSRFHRAVLVLIAGLMPLAALGAAEPAQEDRAFYLLNTDSLGDASDRVAVRFEYRSEGRLLLDHEVTLSPGAERSLLLEIPPLVWPAGAGAPNIELSVYAQGLLVARFDGESLLGYNRTLRQTHAEVVAAFVPGQPDEPAKSPIRRITANIECNSPCGGGCLPSQDYDCDGVANSIDNCTDNYNPGQQDCDGDSWGDVCDFTDGIFQPSGPVDTCMTDKDAHFGYNEFEHHVEQRLVDVSACSSPDQWDNWIRTYGYCDYTYSDADCCDEAIGTSIGQIGDSVSLWCGSKRNQDFCQ
jgi:hypothetical protein